MKNKPKKIVNQLADDCDQILKFFDEDSCITMAIGDFTHNELKPLYEALEKTGIDEDDFTQYRVHAASVAFAMGFICGTGQIVTASNQRTNNAVKALIRAVQSRREHDRAFWEERKEGRLNGQKEKNGFIQVQE